MKKIVVVSMVSRDDSENFSESALVEFHIRFDYILELLKVVLTIVTKVKIR